VGGKNSLVLHGQADCAVAVSVDGGKTWQDCSRFRDGLDLTDRVKGRRQYLLRLGAGPRDLIGSGLTIRTVCQANAAIVPHLKDGGSRVRFAASGRAVVSAGPNRPQAEAHVVEGRFDTPRVALELATPRQEPVAAVYAAAHVLSGSPPRPELKYQIEFSTDGGATWRPLVKDWTIPRRGNEPHDFWSQSLCWGSTEISDPSVRRVRVRFRNDGGRSYARAELHLVYRTAGADGTRVTFDWTDDKGPHQSAHTFAGAEPPPWELPTGRNVQTRWVEFETVPAKERNR
jgi:hypothetical protein